MKFREQRGLWKCIVLAIVLMVSSAKSALAGDPYEEIWRTQDGFIRTIELHANIEREAGKKSRAVWFMHDCDTGWTRGVRIINSEKSVDEPVAWEDEYAFLGDEGWNSTRMPKGNRRYQIDTAKNCTPAIIVENELGLPCTEWSYRPAQPIISKIFPKASFDLIDEQTSDVVGANKRLVYNVKNSSDKDVKIVYDVSIGDGVKIIRCDVTLDGKLFKRVVNSDFKRYGPSWIAIKSHVEMDNRVYDISYIDITINKEYTRKDFLPSPAIGDVVVDNIANLRYMIDSSRSVEELSRDANSFDIRGTVNSLSSENVNNSKSNENSDKPVTDQILKTQNTNSNIVHSGDGKFSGRWIYTGIVCAIAVVAGLLIYRRMRCSNA